LGPHPLNRVSAASEITRRAKSNLAFALAILPKQRRQDMVVFYAFCRTMDDLADDGDRPIAERRADLDHWREGIAGDFQSPNDFEREVIDLRDRRGLPRDLLVAIIDGCAMDLQPLRFRNWDELSEYTWKVACAVGLVSIRLFGCDPQRSEPYAIALGHALQLTNILRDVGEDLANGARVYLPLEDMARFDYSESDLIGRVHDARFLALMEFEAIRAQRFFDEARAKLPAEDRVALRPALVMGEVYESVLARMRKDHFRVFEKRYRLSKPHKLAILSKHLLKRS
jgi:15-cis-phytoene synthase